MEKPKRWKNSPLAGLGVRYIGLGRAHRAFSQTTVARLLLRVALVLPAVASALFLVRHTQTDTSSQTSGTRHSNRHGISWCNAYSLDGQQERETNAISFSPRTVWGPGARRFGIVFFPGASVNRTSCATVAGKPSDRGILVVVLSLQEPTRFDHHEKANKQRALAAIQDVVSETGARVDERVISGHSAGEGTAVTLVSEMKGFCVASTIKIHKGCHRKKDAPRVLPVNGSEDGILYGPKSEKQQENSRPLIPGTSNSKEGKDKSVCATIQGSQPRGVCPLRPATDGRILDYCTRETTRTVHRTHH